MLQAPPLSAGWPGILGLDDEDGGARGLARLQIPVGLRRILQFVTLVDLYLDPAAGHVIEQLPGQGLLLGGIGDVVGQSRTGQVEGALHGQQLRVETLDGTGGGADADHEAAAFKGIERAHEGALADAVKHHVDPGAAGQGTHPGGHIFAAV